MDHSAGGARFRRPPEHNKNSHDGLFLCDATTPLWCVADTIARRNFDSSVVFSPCRREKKQT
jgi:hypothetical protein